jgi:hypothetical protein
MLLAQEYVPDLSEYKDRFMRTPLGLLTQGNVSGAVDRLGADAMLRVDAMSSPEAALQTGMDFMGGGLLGTFVGKGSKLWKQADYNKALKLEKEGATPEQIWQETGTAKFADGQWRQEISDANAIANEMNLKVGNLKSAINHPQLLQSYDDINDVSIYLKEKPSESASFSPSMNAIEIGKYDTKLLNADMHNKKLADVFKTDNQDLINQVNDLAKQDIRYTPNKSSLLHETQHKIQENENWARGGSPSEYVKDLIIEQHEGLSKVPKLNENMNWISKKLDELRAKQVANKTDARAKQIKLFEDKYNDFMNQRMDLVNKYNYDPQQKAYEQYQKLAGEAEARLTQRRIPLTDAERRANFPYASGTDYGLDYPMEELFVQGILK